MSPTSMSSAVEAMSQFAPVEFVVFALLRALAPQAGVAVGDVLRR